MNPNQTLDDIVRALFYTDSALDYDEVLERIECLASWIDSDGFKPSESASGFCWSDILVGAYWFSVDYHSGQWSAEYRLQCIIGRFYSPGSCCNGPESDSVESDTYSALVTLSGNTANQGA